MNGQISLVEEERTPGTTPDSFLRKSISTILLVSTTAKGLRCCLTRPFKLFKAFHMPSIHLELPRHPAIPGGVILSMGSPGWIRHPGTPGPSYSLLRPQWSWGRLSTLIDCLSPTMAFKWESSRDSSPCSIPESASNSKAGVR